MKLLFLRSQLVDVEVRFRNWADFGDVELGFDAGFRGRLDSGRGSRSGGFWLRVAGSRTRWRRGGFGSDAADRLGDFFFERASRAGLEGHSREAG
jgi:hypothetical protein